MRHDHAYIARNTDLCLTTTEKGDAYCEALPDKDIEELMNPLSEMLLLVQNEYVLVEDGSGIDGWILAIRRIYTEQFGNVDPGITKETIIEALSKGFLGLRTVIWVDGNGGRIRD